MDCKIRMCSIDPEKLCVSEGVQREEEWCKGTGKEWYSFEIPQTFRGRYVVYFCADDICGAYFGMSTQDHEFQGLLDKLSFRSPEYVAWVWEKLQALQELGAIGFTVESWPEDKKVFSLGAARAEGEAE